MNPKTVSSHSSTNTAPHPEPAMWPSTSPTRISSAHAKEPTGSSPSTDPLLELLRAQSERFRNAGFKRSRYSRGYIPLFHGRNLAQSADSTSLVPIDAGVIMVDLDEVGVKLTSLEGRAGSFTARDRELDNVVCVEMKYDMGDFVAIWLADPLDPEVLSTLDAWGRDGKVSVILKEEEKYVLCTVPFDLTVSKPNSPMNAPTSNPDERAQVFMECAAEIAYAGLVLDDSVDGDEQIYPRSVAVNVLLTKFSAPLAVGQEYFDAYDQLESFIKVDRE
jgi:hypothetical protein